LDPRELARRDAFFADASENGSRIQCISDSSLQLLEEHFPSSVGKTFRTYLPVQERLSGACENKIESESGVIASDGNYFFYPANFWPHKNHETLLEAYSIYLASLVDSEPWKLVLTGADSTGRSDEIKSLAEAAGCAESVHLLGYVSNIELDLLWRNASALVFPSRHEGFGIPILEAMRYGVPIICSSVYSLTEVAGEAALYFDPIVPEEISEAMRKISSEPETGSELVNKGKERIGLFDPAKEARVLIEEWRRTAGKPVQG
ncbi:MAG: glycosyltransferase family 1 protein, partial [Verrucomicrobiota bacterium]